MTETHSEPFVQLADVGPDRALIAWGSFCFTRRDPEHRWEIVDDEQLHEVVGRRTCIGSAAEAYGDTLVRVLDDGGDVVAEASTSDRTWVWVEGLRPDTEYRYQILVDGEDWAASECWDWLPSDRGGYDLMPSGRRYDLRFRTFPDRDAETPRLRFVALGDYGVGVRSDSESSRRQRRVAEVLDKLVDEQDVRFVISLGDNVYQGEQGQVDDESGGEDDDWYSSFFEPYRYAIARVPFFPAIGNHDSTDSEGSDDRAQMEDNFHLPERFRDDSGHSSLDPGMFYRLRYGRDVELVCLDTSQDSVDEGVHRFFQARKHRDWLDDVFGGPRVRWRIPFSHHPVFCAGPSHHNDEEMLEALVPLFQRGGVRLVLAGHEHNFQVSEVDGLTYLVSGAGGKVREDLPDRFSDAHTTAWAAQSHLLLVDVDGPELTITPISGLRRDGRMHLMSALTPHNEVVYPPFVVRSDVPTQTSTAASCPQAPSIS